MSPKKLRFIENYRKSLGNITIAAKNTDMNRKTYYDWMKKDEEFKKIIEEVNEERYDFIENALFKKIQEGDTASIIFACKTQLKHRGYVERQELTGTDFNITWNEVRYAPNTETK